MRRNSSSVISSILHGNKTLPKQDAEVTYSKIMSRGKFVHEMQVHNVKPKAFNDYLELTKEHYSRVNDNSHFKVKLFASFATEVGPLDQVRHIWEFQNYPGYVDTKKMLKNDQIYQDFQNKLRPMIDSRYNQVMLEFAHWVSADTIPAGGIYELRSYTLKPGRMLEWEQEWRKGLEARRKVIQPVGAFFSQIGKLNQVHHIWNYRDLHDRKVSREKCWEIQGWADTVHRTVPLIEEMDNFILRPLDYSPRK